jgi:hypothetical protein
MAMAFGEMNDALAAKGIKKGDLGRNLTGNNGRNDAPDYSCRD